MKRKIKEFWKNKKIKLGNIWSSEVKILRINQYMIAFLFLALIIFSKKVFGFTILNDTYGPVLLSSFFASLLTLYAVKIPILSDKKKLKQNAENLYFSFLFSIYLELVDQERLLEYIKKEITLVEEMYRSKQEIILDSLITKLNTKFLEECRSKIIELEILDTTLISILQTYINLVNMLEFSTDLRPLKAGIASFNINQPDGIKIYVDSFLGITNKIDKARSMLIQKIKDEFTKYNRSIVDEFYEFENSQSSEMIDEE